jgi:hypothetical protein
MRMKEGKMKTLLIACAGLLALATAAAGQEQAPTTGGLAAMDGNADGSVDGAELDAWATASFTTMDANGDGYVTEAEGADYIPADLYAAANTNGDDGISLQEFQDQARRDFTAADANGDGVLN